jgi:hypothetical protein
MFVCLLTFKSFEAIAFAVGMQPQLAVMTIRPRDGNALDRAAGVAAFDAHRSRALSH